MASWLIRENKIYVPRRSPSDMQKIYGVSFVGADGNAVSNSVAIFNPDMSAVEGFHKKYWKLNGDIVSLMTQAERDAVDSAELNTRRNKMAAQIDNVEDIVRALALSVLDEVNSISLKINEVLDSIDNASNLNDLKSTVAGIADRPQRSIAQLKTAIRNHLGG